MLPITTRTFRPYTKPERAIHAAGIVLQTSRPRHEGVLIRELSTETGYSVGTIKKTIDLLEGRKLVHSKRTENRGNRSHGTIRFVGRIPERRSA